MEKLSKIVSYVFHPLFVPIWVTINYIVAKATSFTTEEKEYLLVQVFLISCLVPGLIVLLLKNFNLIKSFEMSDTKERLAPVLMQCFLFIALLKRGVTFVPFTELHFFFLGALISSIVILMLLMFQIKASIHVLGVSAWTTFVFGLSMHLQSAAPFTIAILTSLAGFVATARLYLEAHTMREVVIGFAVGILPQVGLMFFWA